MKYENTETCTESYEEIFHGYEIYIEPNPDHYRGGYAWSVCSEESELDCGLAPMLDEAITEAHTAIEKIEG